MNTWKNKYYKFLLMFISSTLTVFTISSCRCHKNQPAKYGPPPSYSDTQVEKPKPNTIDVSKADSIRKIERSDNMIIAKYGAPTNLDKK